MENSLISTVIENMEGEIPQCMYENKINEMVNKVETELFNGEEREIPSSVIGEKVMHYLKDLDQVAYVRFASIYREFKDVNTFMDELKKMLDK